MLHAIDLLQTTLDGLLFGSTYALVAIGFTLIWGLLRILNLAHGETVMVGMFVGMLTTRVPGMPMLAGIALAMAGGALVGLAVERICYRPLRTAHELVPMIATLGFWILLEELFIKIYFKVWFRDYVDFANPFDGTGFDLGPLRLRADYLVTLAVAMCLVVVLYLVVYRTRLGLAMRMIAEDHDIGHLMGVPVSRVLTGAFLMSAAYGGAIVGGLTLGVLELVSSYLFSFSYRDAIAMLVLFAVLIFRPQGLVGTRTAERV
jgi:branched-chain amino acid transport system permease protein